MISIVVAYANNRVIGIGNELPWYLPADLKHFRELTTGHTVIMGRKTFDSIVTRNGKALPNRVSIVLSRDPNYSFDGAKVVSDLGTALSEIGTDQEIFIIGGAEIFLQALPFTDKLYVTEIDADIEGDIYFPKFNRDEWRETSRVAQKADDKNPYDYGFVTYERIK